MLSLSSAQPWRNFSEQKSAALCQYDSILQPVPSIAAGAFIPLRAETRLGRLSRLTCQTGVVKLHVPQARLVQHVQLGLVHLRNVLEVLGVARVHALLPGLVLLVAHVEPGGGDHGQLDVSPPLLGQGGLEQLQLVQVALALGGAVAQLGAGDDAVAGHDLALLLDERDYVRVVEAEHAGVGLLQGDGALELVPHQAPEPRAVVLARRHRAEAQVRLDLGHLRHRLLLQIRQPGLLGRLALADGLAGVQEGLGPQQRAHVLGAEGGSHVGW